MVRARPTDLSRNEPELLLLPMTCVCTGAELGYFSMSNVLEMRKKKNVLKKCKIAHHYQDALRRNYQYVLTIDISTISLE